MKRKKLAAALLLQLLILSYSATFPVLTIVHSHNGFGKTGTVSLRAEDERTASRNDPFCCAVCFRLGSTQAIHAPSASPVPDLLKNAARPCERLVFHYLTDRFSLQGRSPPFPIC